MQQLIHQMNNSMYEWCENYPDHIDGMFHFWQAGNQFNLAKALLHTPGNKAIINVKSLTAFEGIAKRLLLFSDILALRDMRGMVHQGLWGLEIPDDFASFRDYARFQQPDLEILKPPAILRLQGSQYVRAAGEVEFRDGTKAGPALSSGPRFPEDTYDWIFGPGRPYFETGQVLFAPFIPSVEEEMEFFRQGVSLPQMLGALPLYSSKADWFDDKTVSALLTLDLPTLEKIDVALLKRVKDDHHDDFVQFRTAILTAVKKVQSAVDTDTFLQEVRHIQRNDIDDSLAKLRVKVERIAKMRSLREAGCLAGVAMVGLGQLMGVPTPAIVAGVSASLVAMIANVIEKLKESGQMQEHPTYFLWRLENMT